jgi:hypothetical protein
MNQVSAIEADYVIVGGGSADQRAGMTHFTRGACSRRCDTRTAFCV